MLALDLDPGRGDVDRHAAELGRLLERLGVWHLADVAPSGGRHVYVLFSSPLPWLELRDVARALALRFPAIDPAPMAGLGGQISPPGSRHKSGGWRVLSTPVDVALSAVEHPNGPEVWGALLAELAAELQQVEEQQKVATFCPSPETDSSGLPWMPRLGGRANLGPELAGAAHTGKWNRSRYADRSAARMAVLAAAVARGWRLADVRAAVASGAWKGLPDLYYRASEPGRMERLLPLEWRKSVAFVAGRETYASGTQADLKLTPPVGESGADEYGLIRMWLTAVLVALEDPDRVRGWGGRVIAVRNRRRAGHGPGSE